MGVSDVVTALDKFFLDIVAHVIPGLSFLVMIIITFGFMTPRDVFELTKTLAPGQWLVIIVAGYPMGFFVNAIGQPIAFFMGKFRRRFLKNIAQYWLDEAALTENINSSDSCKEVARILQTSKVNPVGTGNTDVWRNTRNLRNVALTAIAPRNKAIVDRFTHISVLNLGIATTLLIGVLLILGRYFIEWRMNRPVLELLQIIVPMFFGGIVFLDRHFRFFDRSMRTAFSMFIGEYAAKQLMNENGSSQP